MKRKEIANNIFLMVYTTIGFVLINLLNVKVIHDESSPCILMFSLVFWGVVIASLINNTVEIIDEIDNREILKKMLYENTPVQISVNRVQGSIVVSYSNEDDECSIELFNYNDYPIFFSSNNFSDASIKVEDDLSVIVYEEPKQ